MNICSAKAVSGI